MFASYSKTHLPGADGYAEHHEVHVFSKTVKTEIESLGQVPDNMLQPQIPPDGLPAIDAIAEDLEYFDHEVLPQGFQYDFGDEGNGDVNQSEVDDQESDDEAEQPDADSDKKDQSDSQSLGGQTASESKQACTYSSAVYEIR